MIRIPFIGLFLGLSVVVLPLLGSDLRTVRRADGVIMIFTEGLDDDATLSPPAPRLISERSARLPEDFSAVIDRLARRQNLDPGLVRAVIRVESGFNTRAVSSKGARGLMQLMPATARQLGVDNAFDAVQNVRAGTEYLRRMIDRFGGNLELGLASYNAGAGAVDRYGGIPPFEETTRYVRKVLREYRGADYRPYTGSSSRAIGSSPGRADVRVGQTASKEVLITTEALRR